MEQVNRASLRAVIVSDPSSTDRWKPARKYSSGTSTGSAPASPVAPAMGASTPPPTARMKPARLNCTARPSADTATVMFGTTPPGSKYVVHGPHAGTRAVIADPPFGWD